jgi:hypothetical protein
MKYRIGADVFSDGNLMGQIQYLIVDPRSCEVTHLVVKRKNTETRKIVALNLIEIRTRRAIVLCRELTWASLSDYQPQYYQPSNSTTSYLRMPLPYLHPLYYYPPMEQPESPNGSFEQEAVDDSILHEGAQVYDDGEQRLGEVVSRGEDTEGNLTHLVIQMLNEREIHVPLSWILYTSAENIYLNVSRFAG